MRIREIILDGFKSYANRTVIGPFDEGFNAICGMNGTGKSNIFDAICFVLGITNLKQVRAQSKKALIYKEGQAGVTSASVSIVFDNAEAEGSPIGFEAEKEITVTRQIMIEGKDKYKLNGRVTQAGKVMDMFKSVGLNVNNPHFLIMQGRINQVTTAKPVEILSMVEEAAGTRLFEEKKKRSQKMLTKKDERLSEIEAAVDDEITPQLEKLREQKSTYLEFQRVTQDKERQEHLLVAFDFFELLARKSKDEARKQKLEEELAGGEQRKADMQAEREAKQGEFDAAQSRKADVMKGQFAQLEKEEKECSKELVQATTKHKHTQDTLKSEQKALKKLAATCEESGAQVAEKATELSAAEAELGGAKATLDAATTECKEKETKQRELIAGLADSSDETLGEAMEKKQREATEAATEAGKAKMKLKHESGKEKKLLKQKNEAEKALGSIKSKHSKTVAKLQQLDAKRSSNGYDPQRESQLSERKNELEGSTARQQDKLDHLKARTEAKLEFQFSDPVRGFDRRKVKGAVAKLVQPKDPSACTALEVAAGGSLYQVVVDSAETSKLLLQKGKLRARVTIIPLDKVSRRTIDPAKLERARAIGAEHGGNVDAALSMVDFDDEVLPAVQYALGSTLVCDKKVIDAKGTTLAEKVCFELKTKTVTLDGDLFDPAGTLSGGARPKGNGVLQDMNELTQLGRAVSVAQEELAAIDKELSALQKASAEGQKLEKQYALAQKEAELLETRISESRFGQISKEMEAVQKECSEASQVLEASMEREASLKAEVKELQKQIKNQEANRKRETSKLEAEITKARKAVQKAKKEFQAKQSQIDTVKFEIEALNKEKESAASELQTAEQTLDTLAAEVDEASNAMAEKEAQHSEASKALQAVRDDMSTCEREMSSLQRTITKLDNELHGFDKKMLKVEAEVAKTEEKFNKHTRLLERYEAENEWITHEKAFFGRRGTDYDFEACDIKKTRARKKALEAEEAKLSQKVNHKVMGMIEKAEQDFKDLKSKRNKILADRKLIEETIVELDVRKKQTLEQTWKKVNKDFGSIFSCLLPGAQAKLEPEEGKTVFDGLEVRIAFGGAWKESLVELSGGQRALLALSLVLSLLLYKPAPMYILDEVDAALDLSHTQNVGLMLKKNFSTSQFIVVSHKEGMFSNANVMFRTKLDHGVSTITRSIGAAALGTAAASRSSADEAENRGAANRGKGKGKG
eukprot:g195.t1